MSGKIKRIICTALLIFVLVLSAATYLGSLLNLNIYAQHYQNPITAQVTVTKLTSQKDSDEDITYSAYISYQVDGKDFTDILYDTKSNEGDLPPVDTVFTLALNPNDLTKPLSDLAEPVMTCVMGAMAAYSICMLMRLFHRRQLTKNELGVIDLETAVRDMRALILGRFIRPFSLLNCLSLLYLYNRYPMVFGTGYLVAGVFLGCVWLVCLRNAIRQYNCITNEEFRPIKGLHIYKDVHVDPKTGISSNIIHYRLGQTKWAKSVSSQVYQHTRTGFSISSVNLNCSRKKPFLRYDSNGNACGS